MPYSFFASASAYASFSASALLENVFVAIWITLLNAFIV